MEPRAAGSPSPGSASSPRAASAGEAFWNGLLGPGHHVGPRRPRSRTGTRRPWYASPKEARRADRVEQFAIAAATEAFDQAGDLGVDPARFGTIFATGVGGLHTLEEQVVVRMEKGERRVSPFLVPMMMANAAGAAISMRFGLQGPNETICTACAAGTHAIGNAARLIAWGRCDAVATGGAEAAATITALAGFGNMTALSTSGVSRPFDVDRDGFVMGEGAAVLILEEWEHAVARGATILGEVARRGEQRRRPPHHGAVTGRRRGGRLHAPGARRRRARARPTSRQVNAHGTSTPLNDAAEAEAVAHRVRRARPAGHVDQGRHRSRPRRRRRARGGRRAAVVRAPPDPADGQHQGRRPRHRRRHRRRPRVGARARRSPTTSASAATTAR